MPQLNLSKSDFDGLLFIGDPHLASRTPGFRKDDYPQATLAKLAWCLDYAREHRLLPAILGDLFHQPRANANWLLGEVVALLHGRGAVAIYGNHDVHENELTDDDSIAVVFKAGVLRDVEAAGVWCGLAGGRPVIVGGTSWGRRLPKSFDSAAPLEQAGWPVGSDSPLVFWMTHHDIKLPGYEEQGHFPPSEIQGVDVVINGHIHRPLDDLRKGQTLWITPGNISRVSRGQTTRQAEPSVLRIDITSEGWTRQPIVIPHQPFDEVFYNQTDEAETEEQAASGFVAGLAELQQRRTDSGAGLWQFLDANLDRYEPQVAAEIRRLAKEVTDHDAHAPVKS